MNRLNGSMWDFDEWYSMDEKEPEPFTLIAYKMGDEDWPVIRLGVYDGSDFYDESGIMNISSEVKKWRPLYAYTRHNKEEL